MLNDVLEVVIAPPTLYLIPTKEALAEKQSHIQVSAQNCYFEKDGAFTGEIRSVNVI